MKRIVAAGIVAVLVVAGTALGGAPTATAASCTVAAAGDVAGADDYQTGAQRTGDLIRKEKPDKVLIPGDLAYGEGTEEQFRKYFHPTWGSFKDKIIAAPGNHEARSNFEGIKSYLGDSADDNRGVIVCGWRVILLNPYKGISKAADFVRKDAAAHPDKPLIVVWHEPRWSSGSLGDDSSVQPLWDAAADSGARIVINGHDHIYERHALKDDDGNNAANGTRAFTSGLGGHHIRKIGKPRQSSEARYTGKPAVLFLTLEAGGAYSWSLKSYDGDVHDSGRQEAASERDSGGQAPSERSTKTPLRVSKHADRSSSRAVPTDESLVVSGNVYFYIPDDATDKATFRMDSKTSVTERYAPYDAMTTGGPPSYQARPLNTRKLSNGKHTITADSVTPDLQSTSYTFTVKN